jgi:hypothetical protein
MLSGRKKWAITHIHRQRRARYEQCVVGLDGIKSLVEKADLHEVWFPPSNPEAALPDPCAVVALFASEVPCGWSLFSRKRRPMREGIMLILY